MSQEQPRRDEQLQQPRQNDDEQLETIKYGDVFNVSGDLAANPIAPEDARMMASAETRVLGQMHEAGPADVMRAAAAHNVQVGVLSSRDISDVAKNQGINISETDVPGARVVSECVAGQVPHLLPSFHLFFFPLYYSLKIFWSYFRTFKFDFSSG